MTLLPFPPPPATVRSEMCSSSADGHLQTHWAEITLSSLLPVAINLNTYINDKVQWQTIILIPLSAFLWADKEARTMEESIFVIAALINVKNHRSIILAIVFLL